MELKAHSETEARTPGEGSVSRRRVAGKAVFERLEYGKLCQRPGGPVVPGSECYPIARSMDFTPWVAELCRPWILGIGEDTSPDLDHGTVVRCVWNGEGRRTLVYRLARRHEDGDQGNGRRYWRGRYLEATTPSIDPETCFRALENEPLRGLGMEEAEAEWQPVEAQVPNEAASDQCAEGFIEPAVMFVLSGIPVGVTGPLREESFFLWAHALWTRIPSPLRAALALGWGVEPQVTPSFHLSWAPKYPSRVAVFDVTTGRWRHPELVSRIRPEGGIDLAPFDAEYDLALGGMYLREASGAADPEPDLSFLEDSDHAMVLPPVTDPAIADASAPAILQLFKVPGLRSLDEFRLRELNDWLEESSPSDGQEVFKSSADYFFPGPQRRVIQAGLAAMARPSDRIRGEEVVWRSLVDGGAERDLDLHPEEVAARLALLRALAGDSCVAVVAALRATMLRSAQVEELPSSPRERLIAALDESLDRVDGVEQHQETLATVSTGIGEPYRSWVRSRAAELAVAVARRGGERADLALRALREVSGDSFVDLVCRAGEGQEPSSDDHQRLTAASSRVRERFRGHLLSAWKGDGKQPDLRSRREALLPWVRLVISQETEDPLLFLDGTGFDATWRSGFLDELANEVDHDRVPPTLTARVSASILLHWNSIASRGLQPRLRVELQGWQRLLSLWPSPVLELLTPGSGLPSRDSPEEVAAAAARLTLSRGVLESVLDSFDLAAVISVPKARQLWTWIERSRTGPAGRRGDHRPRHRASVVDLCWQLMAGELRSDLTPDDDDLRRAGKLTRSAGIFRESTPTLLSLWHQAHLGWQLRLLLDAAPQVSLRPTLDQLGALIEFRSWLAEHHSSGGVHRSRKELFHIATLKFHSVKRSGHGTRWQGEYQRSVLWAAFSDVPPEEQGDLGKALRAYAGNGNEARMADLASCYFDSQANHQEEAALRIGRSFLGPVARDAGVGLHLIERMVRQIAQGRLQTRKLTVTTTGDTIRVFNHGSKKELRVAEAAVELIIRLCASGCADALLSGLAEGLR